MVRVQSATKFTPVPMSEDFDAVDLPDTMDTEDEGHPAVTSEMVLVTPAIARDWLDPDIRRAVRDLDMGTAETYAQDMLTGHWRWQNEDPVRFDRDGYLNDGQKRRLAICISMRPLWMRVIRNLPPENVRVMDSGRSRRFFDVLKMDDYPASRNLSALVRAAYLWDAGFKLQKGGRGTKSPSNSEKLAYLAANRELTLAAARGSDIHRGGRKLVPPATASFAYWLCKRADALNPRTGPDGDVLDDTETFVTKWITLKGLDEGSGDPVAALNNVLTSAKSAKARLRPQEILYYWIAAWNYFRTDTPIGKLSLPRGGLNMSNMAEPR